MARVWKNRKYPFRQKSNPLLIYFISRKNYKISHSCFEPRTSHGTAGENDARYWIQLL